MSASHNIDAFHNIDASHNIDTATTLAVPRVGILL